MPFNIGPFELLLVLVLALLILGPGKLPEVGSALGRTIREFRKASTDVEDSLRVDGAGTKADAARKVGPATESAANASEVCPDGNESRASPASRASATNDGLYASGRGRLIDSLSVLPPSANSK